MDELETNSSMDADESSCSTTGSFSPPGESYEDQVNGGQNTMDCTKSSSSTRSTHDSGFSSGNICNEGTGDSQVNRNDSPSSGDSGSHSSSRHSNCVHGTQSSSTSTDSGCTYVPTHQYSASNTSTDNTQYDSTYYNRRPGQPYCGRQPRNEQNENYYYGPQNGDSNEACHHHHHGRQQQGHSPNNMTSPPSYQHGQNETSYRQNNVGYRRREVGDFRRFTPYSTDRRWYTYPGWNADLSYQWSPYHYGYYRNPYGTYTDDWQGYYDRYSGCIYDYQDRSCLHNFNYPRGRFDRRFHNSEIHTNRPRYQNRGNERPRNSGQYQNRGNEGPWNSSQYHNRGNEGPLNGGQYHNRGNEDTMNSGQYNNRGNEGSYNSSQFQNSGNEGHWNSGQYHNGGNERPWNSGQFRRRQNRIDKNWNRVKPGNFGSQDRTNDDVALIARAILSRPDKKMMEKEIYRHISTNNPKYRRSRSGWRDRIRHVLAHNKCFTKLFISAKKTGHPHYWSIHPACTQSFLNGNFCVRHSRREILRFTNPCIKRSQKGQVGHHTR